MKYPDYIQFLDYIFIITIILVLFLFGMVAMQITTQKTERYKTCIVLCEEIEFNERINCINACELSIRR